jgi:hypothetical protein
MSGAARQRPVNVVLIDLNALLTGIVEGILEGDPQVRILSRLRSRQSLRSAVGGTRIDVAIVSGEGETLDAALRELVCERPRLRALAVGGDGNEAALYEVRPHRTALGELSSATLLDAVRRVGTGGCAEAAVEGAA